MGPRAVLATTGAVLVAALSAIAALPAPHGRVGAFLALYAAAFAAYAVAVRAVLRLRACDSALLWIVLVVAVLGRAVMIPASPDLSTDHYRYLWEGRVVREGVNPFAVAPADTALAHLRDADYQRVSHRHMATIYPPLAQGLFALAALVHPGFVTLKIVFLLFELGTVLVLFRLLARRGEPEVRALLFAWSPLVMVETAHSGHLDAPGVFFMALGLVLWAEGRRALAGVALGASFLVKYLTAALVPYLARRRALVALAAMALVAAAGYAPFAGAGGRLADSLRAYGAGWFFNGPPFLALSGLTDDPALARRLLAGAGVAFAVAAAMRERDLARYAFLVIACGLLVAPTVYPWYVTWLVPLLCVFPSRAWLAFTALVPLSYLVWNAYRDTGVWALPAWVLAAEYLPFYALLLWELARGGRRAEHAA